MTKQNKPYIMPISAEDTFAPRPEHSASGIEAAIKEAKTFQKGIGELVRTFTRDLNDYAIQLRVENPEYKGLLSRQELPKGQIRYRLTIPGTPGYWVSQDKALEIVDPALADKMRQGTYCIDQMLKMEGMKTDFEKEMASARRITDGPAGTGMSTTMPVKLDYPITKTKN